MRAVAAVLGLYLLYALVAVQVYPDVLYPFDDTPHWMPELAPVAVEASAGPVHLVHAPGDGPLVLFFMGNTGALARHPSALRAHLEAGRALVALQYPGGGGLPGAPSEAGLKARALAAHDWAAARYGGPVVVHGYSLGSALALHVAARRDVAAVVLDAPFARVCEQMTRASLLPACWLPGVERWDSLAEAGAVRAPVLIRQGARDDLVLPEDSARLAEALRGAGVVVTREVLDGADHNDLFRHPRYRGGIAAFLAGLN